MIQIRQQTWMMNKSAFSVCLLDFVLVGPLVHAEDLVVVLPLALLQLQLGVLRRKEDLNGKDSFAEEGTGLVWLLLHFSTTQNNAAI